MSENAMDHPSAQFGPAQARIELALTKARRLALGSGWGGIAVLLAGAMWEDFVRSPEYNGAYTQPPKALQSFAESVESYPD